MCDRSYESWDYHIVGPSLSHRIYFYVCGRIAALYQEHKKGLHLILAQVWLWRELGNSKCISTGKLLCLQILLLYWIIDDMSREGCYVFTWWPTPFYLCVAFKPFYRKKEMVVSLSGHVGEEYQRETMTWFNSSDFYEQHDSFCHWDMRKFWTVPEDK